MREYLTSDDICNEISMTRSVYNGLVLMVEGVTDQRLFAKFSDKDHVKIFIAHSKDNVKSVVRFMSRNRRDSRVLGIIDADLDKLRRNRAEPPLFYTDCRDMETMVIKSNALNDVIDEYGDGGLVSRFEESVGPIRDALVSASYPIGLLMFISQEEGLGLSFKDLDFARFIDPRSLSLDARAMVSDVVGNSVSCKMSRSKLFKKLDDAARDLDDMWVAARGHDAVSILLMGLKRNFGSFNSRSLMPGELGGALRLAFSDADFMGTQLYRDTLEWSEGTGIRLWDMVVGPGCPPS